MAVEDPAVIEDEIPPGWKRDKQGRIYIGRRGKSGVVYRQGSETPEEAQARDERDRDKDVRPKAKETPGKTPKPPASDRASTKEIEFALTEMFSMPSMYAGLRGDTWAADHFTREAPNLARNLAVASEHNPWLRSKLESAVAGENVFGGLLLVMSVGNALLAYAIPPLLYYAPGLPFVDERAREMFGVPERQKIERGAVDAAYSEGAAGAVAAAA